MARTSTLAALVATALGVAPLASGAETALAPHQVEARELLRTLIETDTTHSSGDTTAAARALEKKLLDAGFARDDVRVLEEVPKRGNLVVRLRGRAGGPKPILLLAHLDVVEAERKDWSVDPFRFLERDGYYWGRGTTDDKDEAAINVANLMRLKREGFVPSRDIIVALTADEEAGDHNGVVWLLAKHRPLIDAAFALNEGGGGVLKDGKRVANQVQASEKIYQTFELEVTDKGGHSSLPRSENAIYALAEALLRVRGHTFPVQLNEVTRSFFERAAAAEEPEIAQAMRGALQSPPDPGSIERLAQVPPYNARLRTTCVATQLQAGHAENALPQRAKATVNCRILPDGSADAIEAELRRVIANPSVAIQRLPDPHAIASPPSPLTKEVLGSIESTTEELWPGVPVIPTMSTGATDGLFLRNAGIPVYGVSGVFEDVVDVRAHGKDERVLIQSFFDAQEFMYRLVKRLAGGDAPSAPQGAR